MQKIVSTHLLSLFSLMLTGCIHTSLSMMEQGGSKDATYSFENKPEKYRFIDNEIVSYKIINGELACNCAFTPRAKSGFDADKWEQEKTKKGQHEKLFNYFAQIIPQELRKNIKYFSIIDPKGNQVGDTHILASIGPKNRNSLEDFCLSVAFNLESFIQTTHSSENTRYNALGYSLPIYVFIHEFGHYMTMNNEQQYLVEGIPVPKENSILAKIISTPGWKKITDLYKSIPNMPNMADILKGNYPKSEIAALLKANNEKAYQCTKKLVQQEEFVTEYPTKSFSEDAAETFAHFVLTDERPEPGLNGAKDKVLLFYQDPKMVQTREVIRDNLNKKGIRPNMSKEELTKLFNRLSTSNLIF
ncbi:MULTISPECIES: hypothetical protein [Candidatus Cardinium]|uniref:hypothetical protein n=1 Tax=Candidatus Cardinium TaxID=273135 RepID=UPI001FAAE7F2|nr:MULTISPECIES: hypothetical protein [Cardinium]